MVDFDVDKERQKKTQRIKKSLTRKSSGISCCSVLFNQIGFNSGLDGCTVSAEYKVGRGHRIDGNTAAVVATAAIDGRAPMSQSMALPRAESIRTLRPAIQCAAVRNGGEATPSEKKRVDGTCSIEKKKEKRTALGGVAEIWRQLQLESISYAVVNETPTGTLPSFSLNGARWPAALVFCLFVFFFGSVPF